MTLKVLVCAVCQGTGGKNDDCHKCKGVGRYQQLRYSITERRQRSMHPVSKPEHK